MKRNEFETWMKGKIEDEQYLPTEGMWNKLHLDLQPPASKTKTFIFTPWLKMAAALALIISLGAGSYFIFNKENANTPEAVVTKTISTKKKIIEGNVETSPKKQVIVNGNQATPNFSTSKKSNPGQNGLIFANIDTTSTFEVEPETIGKKEEKNVPAILVENNNQQAHKRDSPITQYFIREKTDEKRRSNINMGIAANVGKPSVGSVGYQLGVVGRADISKKIFAEASIAVASTAVNYAQKHTFSGMESSNDGFVGSSVNTTTNISANFARNVISVGVSPSLGVKITRKLSVAGGGALYRNLNPQLTLTNRNEIEAAAIDKAIISTSEKVSNWDLGLTGNADYRITTQLSFNANYRQGLSNYLHYNNKYHKNSGFNFGLKYIFSK